MNKDKCRELFMREQGTQKEQEQGMQLMWLNKENGNHPFFKVSNSKRIKNKRRSKRK